MLKRLSAALIAAAIALPGVAQAQSEVTFVQATQGFLQLPLYVARAKGYFKAEGLDAKFVVAKGGSAALAAVIGGSGNIYVGVPSSAFHARAKGQDLMVFGALMKQYASNVVVSQQVAKKAGLTNDTPVAKRLAALKGLRMGITGPGSATDQLTRFLAEKAGYNPDRDITIVPLGSGSAVIAAFSRGRIDGFCFSSPTAETAVVKHNGFMLLQLSKGEYEPLDGFLYVTMNAKESWLAAHPEIATKAVKAVDKALKLLKDDPEAGRAAMRSFFPNVDKGIFNEAFKNNLAAYPADARVTRAGIERVFAFMKAGEGAELKLKVAEVYTNKYVDAAK